MANTQIPEKLAVAKLSKRKRTAYEQYLRDLHDEASWNAHQRFTNETVVQMRIEKGIQEKLESIKQEMKAQAKEEVKEEMKAQAKEEVKQETKIEIQLEIAKNLLRNKATVELVAAATGLSIETIKQIEL